MSWRAALVAALNTDKGVTTALGGAHAYEVSPKAAPFPHVALGTAETKPWDSQTSRGAEHLLTLHVWSRSANARQAQAILAALDDWAEKASFTAPGFRLVSLRNVFWSALASPEEGLFHGLMRLRIVLEKE